MNMKHVLAALAVIGLALSHSPAQAAGDTGVYVAPRLSFNIHQLTDMHARGYQVRQKLDTGYDQKFGIGLAVGYDLFVNYTIPARVELEAMYIARGKENDRSNSLLGGSYNYSQENSAKVLFANGYFDVHNSSIFTPYVGGGIGAAWVESKGSLAGYGAPANTESNFAWNVSAGVGVELNYNATIDLGYRYARLGDARTGITATGNYLDSNLGVHQLMLGLRYAF